MRRTASGFAPCDEEAINEVRRVPIGKPVLVEIKAARNPKQHRLLWAMLTIIAEAGEFPSTDAALITLKTATGLVEAIQMDKNGTVQLIPKSISFANMRQTEFAAWFESAINVVVTRWLPNMTNEELRAEIESMVA
jgi:hypothetical protein